MTDDEEDEDTDELQFGDSNDSNECGQPPKPEPPEQITHHDIHNGSVNLDTMYATHGKYLTVIALRTLPDIVKFAFTGYTVDLDDFLFTINGSRQDVPHRFRYYFFRRLEDQQWFAITDYYVTGDLTHLLGSDAITVMSHQQLAPTLLWPPNRLGFWTALCQATLINDDCLSDRHDPPYFAVPNQHAVIRKTGQLWEFFKLTLPIPHALELTKAIDKGQYFKDDTTLYTVAPCILKNMPLVRQLRDRMDPYSVLQYRDCWEHLLSTPLHGLFTIQPHYTRDELPSCLEVATFQQPPPMGYLACWPDKGRLIIFSLAIEPDFRRRGLATKLVQQVSTFIPRPETIAVVNAHDDTVIDVGPLFKKLGFHYNGKQDTSDYHGVGVSHVFADQAATK